LHSQGKWMGTAIISAYCIPNYLPLQLSHSLAIKCTLDYFIPIQDGEMLGMHAIGVLHTHLHYILPSLLPDEYVL